MRDVEYTVRGFLTVRGNAVRVPLRGSLRVHTDEGSGRFTADLVLRQASIDRTILGRSLFRADVQITASEVTGGIDADGTLRATARVDAVMTAVRAAGRTLIGGGGCRTATHAVVPLRSRPGFDLERGGRVVGRYDRPPFTGCGRLTPVVNLLVAGSGNVVVIDLVPRPAA